jgi:amino acid transporter
MASQLIALILTLAIIMVYILGNIALIRFYRKEYPSEFSIWLHGIFPIISSLFMVVALIGSIFPVPAYPLNLAPYLVIIWLIIGLAVLAYLHRKRPETIEDAKLIFTDDITE